MISANQSSWNSKVESERSSSDVQNNPIDSSEDLLDTNDSESERTYEVWDYKVDYETGLEMETPLNQFNDLIPSSTIEGDNSISNINDII